MKLLACDVCHKENLLPSELYDCCMGAENDYAWNCSECIGSNNPFASLEEAGTFSDIDDADIQLFEALHGDESWFLARLDVDDWETTATSVPYSDSSATIMDSEPKMLAKLNLIYTLYMDGELVWVRDDSRKGQMILGVLGA